MPRFVLLLKESPGDWDRLEEDEQARLMALYGEWVAALQAREVFRDGAALSTEVRLIAPSGEVAAETGEATAPTGYFVFEALDWDDAVETARGCPGLGHGATLELRQASES